MQSGINRDGTALGFMVELSDLLDEFYTKEFNNKQFTFIVLEAILLGFVSILHCGYGVNFDISGKGTHYPKIP